MVYNIKKISPDEYRNIAFERLLTAISNRRLIQHLRLDLFKKIDYQPKDIIRENLLNSQIMDDVFYQIKFYSEEILGLLKDQVYVYSFYFKPCRQGLARNVRDMLLPGEEELFTWEEHYKKWLTRFVNDEKRMMVDPIGYHQKLYEFIIMDMTYGDVYDNIHIVE